jgi:Protein of unknown function (DUF1569)
MVPLICNNHLKMKNLHDLATLNEITGRLNQLNPNTQRQWGKMDVAQMMAHCSNALEVNLGDRVGRQGLMAKLFGKLAKKSVVSEKPFKQGLPTDPNFVITDAREFEKEKQRLTELVSRLSNSDPEALAQNAHPFFGKMSAQEWNTLNYKHLDHHLRQFGC